jgi:hypothetical protein
MISRSPARPGAADPGAGLSAAATAVEVQPAPQDRLRGGFMECREEVIGLMVEEGLRGGYEETVSFVDRALRLCQSDKERLGRLMSLIGSYGPKFRGLREKSRRLEQSARWEAT